MGQELPGGCPVQSSRRFLPGHSDLWRAEAKHFLCHWYDTKFPLSTAINIDIEVAWQGTPIYLHIRADAVTYMLSHGRRMEGTWNCARSKRWKEKIGRESGLRLEKNKDKNYHWRWCSANHEENEKVRQIIWRALYKWRVGRKSSRISEFKEQSNKGQR